MTDPIRLASLIDFNAGDSKLDLGSLNGLDGLKSSVMKSKSLRQAITGALAQALDVDIATLLGPAWQAVEGVKAALKATRADATASAIIPMAPHKLKSSHAPTVSLVVAGCPPIDLVFAVEFTLKIDSAELEISGGRIAGLKSGGVSAHAVLKFAGRTLMEKTSPRYDLPGRLNFKAAGAEPEAEAA